MKEMSSQERIMGNKENVTRLRRFREMKKTQEEAYGMSWNLGELSIL